MIYVSINAGEVTPSLSIVKKPTKQANVLFELVLVNHGVRTNSPKYILDEYDSLI